MCVFTYFKSWRKWKDKSLGRVGEITGTKRERKMLALRKENKAKNERICRIIFKHSCKTA